MHIEMPHRRDEISRQFHVPANIPELDRLRGLAIVMVVLFHSEGGLPRAFAPIAHQLWVGVDLFFVLSGFLISGILWNTRESSTYYRAFYGRRVLRIWPAYATLLVVSFGILHLASRLGNTSGLGREALPVWVYLLMVQNWAPGELKTSPLLLVTWSLAIEEQFYLLWPTVIRKIRNRHLLWFVCVAILLQIVARVVAVHTGVSQTWIYYNPLTHGDGLLMGAAVAIWLRVSRPQRTTLRNMGFAAMFFGTLCFLVLLPSQITSRYCSPLVFTSCAVASSGLLLLALVSADFGARVHHWIFLNRPLAFLGKISYGLYLFHFLFIRLAVSEKLLSKFDRWGHPSITRFAMMVSGIVFSILIAWLSRITIEEYALSKKTLFRYHRSHS